MKTVLTLIKYCVVYAWAFFGFFLLLFTLHKYWAVDVGIFRRTLVSLLEAGMYFITPVWFILSVVAFIKSPKKRLLILWTLLYLAVVFFFWCGGFV